MSYRHLTIKERESIWQLRKQGKSCSAIGKEIGYHASTVSRELRRNRAITDYWPHKAQRLSEQRRKASSPAPKRHDTRIVEYVCMGLSHDWSPEEIAHRMTLDYPEDSTFRVSHETIYRWIKNDSSFMHGTGASHLRQNKRKRRKKYGSGRTQKGKLTDTRSIHERPSIVEERSRVGDWEGDTVEGKKGTGCLVSLVCRSNRYTILGYIPHASAAALNACTVSSFARHGIVPCHTLTVDNGKEFSAHKKLEEDLGCKIYFAYPYHAWQRGTNENTNGLLRQYFPKGADFRHMKLSDIVHVEGLLNNRPRKILNYRTPFEMMKEMKGIKLQL